MQDKRPGCVSRKALTGELIGLLILGQIELQSSETFGLDAKHHDDLRLAESGLEVALYRNPGTGIGRGIGQELRRSAENHPRSEAGQQEHVGAGDTAVEDVAGDGDENAKKQNNKNKNNTKPKKNKKRAENEQHQRGML